MGGDAHGSRVDAPSETARGIRAIKFSLLGLGVTAIPLWIAFGLGRRPPTRRYPYGFHRAEDLAGILIVLAILASAALAGWQAVMRLAEPHPLAHTSWVAAAGALGFLGNELVAEYRIRVGRRIGSAAPVAAGQHARTDRLPPLGVVAGAIGAALGYPAADPIAGLAITVAILSVLKDAGRQVVHRIMDGTEESTIVMFEEVAAAVPGVEHVTDVRARWAGHRLIGELSIDVDRSLTVEEGHPTSERLEPGPRAAIPSLRHATVHVEPHG